MGVWIETDNEGFVQHHQLVTPCMGVWIETSLRCLRCRQDKSHPVWVCGLKQTADNTDNEGGESHPVWVCGLKHFKI